MPLNNGERCAWKRSRQLASTRTTVSWGEARDRARLPGLDQQWAWTFKLREISGCFRRPLRFPEFQCFSYKGYNYTQWGLYKGFINNSGDLVHQQGKPASKPIMSPWGFKPPFKTMRVNLSTVIYPSGFSSSTLGPGLYIQFSLQDSHPNLVPRPFVGNRQGTRARAGIRNTPPRKQSPGEETET